MTLTLTPVQNIPLVEPGDELALIIHEALDKQGLTLESGDILVITQKIVSKAENRFVNFAMINPSDEATNLATQVEKDPRLIELIIRESKKVLRYRPGTIIVEHRLGFVCANAGIDHSNVRDRVDGEEWVLLLPENPDRNWNSQNSKM